MAKLADARALGARGATLGGSSPLPPRFFYRRKRTRSERAAASGRRAPSGASGARVPDLEPRPLDRGGRRRVFFRPLLRSAGISGKNLKGANSFYGSGFGHSSPKGVTASRPIFSTERASRGENWKFSPMKNLRSRF